VARDKQILEQEKKKWEEEKAKFHSFDHRKIVLDVGGTRYTTSRSTLTKHPESMLGVMFSGRHDIEAMKCSDGSFFNDRDGGRFKYILDYLRDGEKVVYCFPKSPEIMGEILREAMYYQLESLVAALMKFNTVSRNDILLDFDTKTGYHDQDYGIVDAYGRRKKFRTYYVSKQVILYNYKVMKEVSFNSLEFCHSVLFINCNLSNASFRECCFKSAVTFEDCTLDGTTFDAVCGLLTNVSFTGSNTDKTKFESSLREALQSAGKIID